jgi:hypothetical protein
LRMGQPANGNVYIPPRNAGLSLNA